MEQTPYNSKADAVAPASGGCTIFVDAVREKSDFVGRPTNF
jgi:hypothetical protein